MLGIRRKQISFFFPVFTNVTTHKTPSRERAFFSSYSTNLYYCSKRWEIDTFVSASFNEIRNCSHMEKIRLFYIQCFFLFAGDDIKMNELELHFYKVFQYKYFCKKTIRKIFTRKD